MIKVDAKDLDRFTVKIKEKAMKGNETGIRKAIQKSCLSIKKEAIQNITSNESIKTGHLRRSIAFKTTMTEGIVHTSNVKYARVVEDGSKSHIIRAKNKKALYWQGASHPVKQVKHPGTKAKPYLIPAFEDEKPKFIENLKEVIKFD